MKVRAPFSRSKRIPASNSFSWCKEGERKLPFFLFNKSAVKTSPFPPEVLAYRPELDALRAIAVIGVLLSHWHPVGSMVINWGLTGVYLFFSISGYVITHGLMKDALTGAPARLIVTNFYLRRALRILPIYFTLITICLLFWPEWPREATPWHLGFLSNYWFGHLKSYAFPIHFWSLSVEQQFYLLWPFAVLYIPTRGFPVFCIGLILLAPVSRLYFSMVLGNDQYAYYALTSNTDCLAIGAFLAWSERYASYSRLRQILCGKNLIYLGAATFFASIAAHYLDYEGVSIALGGTACSFLAPWIIKRFPDSPFGFCILRKPYLIALGKISYGIYLYHLFVGLLVFQFLAPYKFWLSFQIAVAFAFTTLASSASWQYFERPILTQANRFRS